MGKYHALNVGRAIRHAKLVAVCDVNADLAGSLANDFGGICKITNDVSELLEDRSIQAVIIATPSNTHYELALAAIQSNKAIFLEKPLASRIDEARVIVNMVKESDVLCQVGFMRRYDPYYLEAKSLIDSGEIGDPVFVKSMSRDPVAPSKDYLESSGGIFVDVSIHDYDILRFLTRQEILSVQAVGAVVLTPECREVGDVDLGISFLELSNGACGEIEAYRNAKYGYDIRAEILGTKGAMFIFSNANYTGIALEGTSRVKWHKGFLERFDQAYIAEIQDFVDCVISDRPPRVTVEDAFRAQLAAEAATRSLSEGGRKITLDQQSSSASTSL